MTDGHPQPPLTLSPFQASRVNFARRDLDQTRAQDLAQLDGASLILLIDKLSGRLCDMLDIISETSNGSSRCE
ncbi:hypothetical protein [Streptomyces bauhiniae]|uniref:Uncharacterized protein n=1 Tax=Streptomyces bauhiniae TaxID=2340725 RepID=A0A7K3QRD4_9ACTN|nr:hypothetical protein [Streptomyces bauhiniae]NEB92469.1 hypothetical protein [Streptomyces bauhiniae]